MADEPVIERIAQDLVAAVNTVSTDNGYNQDLSCERPNRPDWENMPSIENGLVVMLQGETERTDANDMNHSIAAWRQMFTFVIFVIQSDDSTTVLDTKINRARADLEKAISADPNREDDAIDTVLKGAVRFDTNQASSGVAVMAEVHYRTTTDDPYTAR